VHERDRRRLANGLVIYGVVGLVIAVLGVVAALGVNARADDLAGKATARLETAGHTIDSAATALDRTTTALSSLSLTLSLAANAITTTAPEIAKLTPTLNQLEEQANNFSVLGQKPLSSLGPLFGQLAGVVDVASKQLVTVATALKGNSETLLATVPALNDLSSWLRQFRRELTDGGIEEGLVGALRTVTIVLLLLTAWFAVPAIGALLLGIALRRRYDGAGLAAPTAPAQ
jgi:hypothetical protein